MSADLVAGFHDAHAGITEDLLGSAPDAAGRTIYDWLVQGLPDGGVLDLACGSAPVADIVGAGAYLGVDRSAAELARARARRPRAALVRADVESFSARAPVASVTLSMALMLVGLDALLPRVASWLAPGGRLHATVPLRDPAVLAGTAYGELARQLGVRGRPFPEPLPAASLAGRLARHGLTLDGDDLGWFACPVGRDEDRERLLASFYVPGDEERLQAARTWLASREEPALPYPVRRVTARR
jgi:SAM-dependent methyltransferase